MQIKNEFSKKSKASKLLNVLFTIVLVFGAGFIFANFDIQKTKKWTSQKYFQLVHAKEEIPKIRINVNFKNMRKLDYYSQVLQKAGAYGTIHHGAFKQYVPGSVDHAGKNYKAQIRLKGDKQDHFGTIDNKWSYLIKLKGDDTLLGIKKFSLQHPATRSFLNSWFYHKLLDNEGLINLRVKYVKIFLNNKDLGIYALEEHFGKELIENNSRREGPIVRFDENYFWNPGMTEHNNKEDKEFMSRSPVIGMDSDRSLKDAGTTKMAQRAISMLDGFRKGKLTVAQVFDMDHLSKYFSILTIVNGFHALRWHNIRFYYNPVTSLLEPLGFDANSGGMLSYLAHDYKYNDISDQPLFKLFFDDPVFLEKYVMQLDRMSNLDYFGKFIAKIQPEYKKQLNILRQEFPNYTLSLENYKFNVNRIHKIIHPNVALNGFLLSEDNKSITLRVANAQSLPIEILGLETDGVKLEPLKKELLEPKLILQSVDYKALKFKKTKVKKIGSDAKLIYRVVGSSQARAQKLIQWPFATDLNLFEDPVLNRQGNINEFPFIKIEGDWLHIQPGQWEINKPLIIPSGYKISGTPKTTLNLSNNAYIVSYSPLFLTGTPESPFEIISKSKTGQGLMVINAKERSKLRYIRFKNLSAPNQGAWSPTGAVTFYNSSVTFENCLFDSNINGDDYLNIVNSNFLVHQSYFVNVKADALDVDFGVGQVANSTFENIGNDAIDFSGSRAQIKMVQLKNIGDKGVSGGEGSEILIEGLNIDKGKIGVASKDNSKLRLTKSIFKGLRYQMAAYQKKPEFGPGFIAVSSPNKFLGVENIAKDKSSIIKIDGKNYLKVKLNMEDIIGISKAGR